MKESILKTKSKEFAFRIIKLYQFLQNKNEFILSKQVLRSGTSIGANICEASFAQSKKDFTSKLYIAIKETAETQYWLELLENGNYIEIKQAKSMISDCTEIAKMLHSSIKTSKKE